MKTFNSFQVQGFQISGWNSVWSCFPRIIIKIEEKKKGKKGPYISGDSLMQEHLSV